mmetsp:Transcript_21314/g.25660  ORF Transcript_21314/g.25660 Transcript_21314/m.25660 type:complete len:162 (-) Transcript_21314:334-819(-)|eukprot:CAMPEP_0197310580 /NCGR_PEP_ID=MMETSP0891-20130614/9146_1 /TAXON_ID=44058 ORGANISM="Aureoumbra lagunensis, Strain CCMP1510" /NCGR_SAMPLE_ID=MMETSP0891 /ASSEMBLY_ACC=CAM_ASM_000534 /LENGTH=161 /DNA_ID=CAMNT_0042796281 /DNA_START=166 /DNA_END=651 /DNA_ORIENTATION=+
MKLIVSSSLFFVLLGVCYGLSPNHITSRRQALVAGGLIIVPTSVIAASDVREAINAVESTAVGADRNAPLGMDNEYQPQQQGQRGKIDLNAAIVTEYKQFPGMYPTVAGKIASHGPYKNPRDVYQYLDGSEKATYKKYEQYFIALPAGRMFNERVNQRQSV